MQKKESYRISEMLGIGSTYVYIIAMLLVYPVFYRENLLNLIVDKKEYFLFFTLIYCVFLCPALIENIVLLCRGQRKFILQLDILFVGITAAAVVISTMLSIDRNESLNGLGYRTVAADVFVLCLIIYLGIRAFGKYDTYVIWSWLIGSVLIYLFGILCACGINFLHMQDELSLPHIFLTPLGNTNFNATYVCLVLPLVLVMYMLCKERFSKTVYFVVMYMGFLFSFFIKTESSLITMLASLAFLFFFALEKEQWSVRYVEMLGIYILANTTVSVIWNLFGDKIYKFDGLGAFLIQTNVVVAEWLIYIALVLLLKWKKDVFRTKILSVRKQLLYACGVLAIVGVIVVILLNTVLKEQAENGILQMFLLTDKSFSRRGMLWRNTIELLKQSEPLQIVFGHGLNCYGTSIAPICYDEMVAEFGFLMQDPHNEFLQVLTDMGIAGTIGYYGIQITTLVYALRNWRKNELSIVIVLSVSSYMLQGMVNCYALTHFPILFILLGLGNGYLRKDK